MTAKQDRFRAFLDAKRAEVVPPSESPANRWIRREIDRAHGRTSVEDAEREELKADLARSKAELARSEEELRSLREE